MKQTIKTLSVIIVLSLVITACGGGGGGSNAGANDGTANPDPQTNDIALTEMVNQILQADIDSEALDITQFNIVDNVQDDPDAFNTLLPN